MGSVEKLSESKIRACVPEWSNSIDGRPLMSSDHADEDVQRRAAAARHWKQSSFTVSMTF